MDNFEMLKYPRNRMSKKQHFIVLFYIRFIG